MEVIDIIILILLTVSIVVSVFTLTRFAAIRREINDYRIETGRNINEAFSTYGNMMYQSQTSVAEIQDKRLTELSERIRQMSMENERQLDRMRETVDEKLQKTLEERLGQSFQVVSARLDEVSRGLGEMQTLAGGVGDLKKVLTNVKTRGILGEVQLAAILEEVLAPEQYAQNVNTRGEGSNVVEFAVRLPGEYGSPVWLPIDSKFPGDSYIRLVDAYEEGDPQQINIAQKQLVTMLKREAKDIRDKYIAPPATTNFGILFLPFEGLYAEACRLGMIEVLQREYQVNLAGPTTMAAFLNSLQMGFRTLAIQRRSNEVWEILGAVKTEFGKFEEVLLKAQKNLNMVSGNLDELIGARTRVMQKKLKDVTAVTEDEISRFE